MNFILKKFDKINYYRLTDFSYKFVHFVFHYLRLAGSNSGLFYLVCVCRLATFVHGFVASVESVKHCPNQAKHKFPNKLHNIFHQSVFIVSFPHHHGV